MKTRFKHEPNDYGNYCFELCREYPNCKCDGHYIWEYNKITEGKKHDEK